MKRSITIVFVMLLSAWIAGCAYTRSPYLNSKLAMEDWQKEVETNPSAWVNGSDGWFMTGDPKSGKYKDKAVEDAKQVSTMKVDVPEFTNVVANGDFQVQIFGTYGQNSVYAYGPQSDLRSLEIKASRGTLYVNQVKDAKKSVKHVIVRIGVSALSGLSHSGGGTVEAIQLPASALSIKSSGSGNIYLSGNVELRKVDSSGKGNINVFGTKTPTLDITMTGLGSVNVSGIVGIHVIQHHGKGDVNIIGANSDSLTIKADGSGKIGISGIVNLKEIQARDNVSVFIDCVNADGTYVYAMQKARVGLTGNANNLYLYASGVSAIYGRTMYAQSTYAQARDGSHVNAAATNKIFASASGNGSVYFFGDPQMMSQFVTGNGVVIPVWSEQKIQKKRVYKDAPPTAPRYKWVNGKMVTYSK